MAINASGAIQLSGSVAGSSIALELGLSANSTVSLGGAGPRGLAGIASGAIRLAQDFYGKSSGPTVGVYFGGYTMPSFTRNNVTTRINTCGALVGSQTNVGSARSGQGGATVGVNALYYGGYQPSLATPNNSAFVTRINSSGALVGSETQVGCARLCTAGALVGTNGVFFSGGWSYICCTCGIPTTIYCRRFDVVRINACGTSAGINSSITLGVSAPAGSPVGSVGLYYTGTWSDGGAINRAIRYNSSGTQVGSVTTLGTSRVCVAGAPVTSSIALFYGGFLTSTVYRLSTRINACGAIIGTEQTLASASVKAGGGGARVGAVGVFYAGRTGSSGCGTPNATVTRVNSCGTFVSAETTVGTARHNPTGAGL